MINPTNMNDKKKATTAPNTTTITYRSRGERYLATTIPGLFNLTVGYLELKEFGIFVNVYQANARCRKHWPQLAQHVHRADPHLFSVFLSKAALRWVLFSKGIDARDWKLHLKVLGNLLSHRHSFVRVCMQGDMDIVKAMVDTSSQVDLELRDGRYGKTPLHWASENGHLPMVTFLCEQGAGKEARTHGGRTPLHAAAYEGHLSVVQYLCEQGADKEASNGGGRTPLHVAARDGRLPVVQYLCEQGADKEARDRWGKTPWECTGRFSRVGQYLKTVSR